MGQGHKTYAALAPEVTWGAKVVTGMEFVEYLSETNQKTVSEKVQAGINNTRVRTKRSPGNITVAGTVPFEVAADAWIGRLLKNLLPTETFTLLTGAPNAGKHVFKTGESLPAGLTVQIHKDVETFDYYGGRVVSLSFESPIDDFLKCTPTFSFRDVDKDGVAQVPVYTQEDALIFHKGTIKIDDVEAIVTSFTMTIAAGLKVERRRIGSQLILQQQAGLYEITGQIGAYFEDMTLVEKFLAQEPASLNALFEGTVLPGTGVNRGIEFDLPQVYFNGQLPVVPGADGEIVLTLPWRAIKGAGEVIEVTLQNEKALAY